MTELVLTRREPKKGLPREALAIFVGHPKSGKTYFSASFPDSYVLELEPKGADQVPGIIHDIKNLTEFREVLGKVVKEPSIKTIVIDTLDVLSDWLEDEVAHSRGLENITQRKQGVDGYALWNDFRAKIEGFIHFIKDCGKFVILCAHCREPKLDAAGNLIVPAGINVPGRSGSYIAGQAEMIGYAYKKQMGSTTNYYISFQGGPLGNWGSRYKELNDKTILIPEENPYSAFSALFENSKQTGAAQ